MNKSQSSEGKGVKVRIKDNLSKLAWSLYPNLKEKLGRTGIITYESTANWSEVRFRYDKQSVTVPKSWLEVINHPTHH